MIWSMHLADVKSSSRSLPKGWLSMTRLRARRRRMGLTTTPSQLVRLDLARYDTEPIPEREWGVRDRFPRRSVVLLSGEGAVGKSVLFLQLAAAHVLSLDWLRSMPEPGPVLLVNCEDEGDELVRRLEPILKNYRAKFSEIAAGLHAFSLAEHQDPLLAVSDRSGRIV